MLDFLASLHKYDDKKVQDAREATLRPGKIYRRREYKDMDLNMTSWEWKVMMKILPQLIDIPHPIFHMILQGMIITKFPSISLQSPHYICSFN
jgi:hypothetical protein